MYRILFALILIIGCATPRSSPELEFETHWSDSKLSMEAIYCAVAQIDGPDIAKRVVDVNIQLSPGLIASKGFVEMFYSPRTLILDSTYDSAWHSGLRYGLLCRVRLYLIDGRLGTCTADRWNNEIKPRYTPTLSVCYREAEERQEQ